MPAILVHGVPDAHRVWAGVRRHLTRTDGEAWTFRASALHGRTASAAPRRSTPTG
jgi:hypothetical protein